MPTPEKAKDKRAQRKEAKAKVKAIRGKGTPKKKGDSE
jgi:hypothetical protein